MKRIRIAAAIFICIFIVTANVCGIPLLHDQFSQGRHFGAGELKQAAEPEAEETCIYGVKNASGGRVIGLGIALGLSVGVCVFAWIPIVGIILYPVFGFTSIACAGASLPIIFDLIVMNFPTWKYYGPGSGHVRGVTGNHYLKGVSIFASTLNKIGTAVAAIVLAFSEENKFKSFFGLLVSLGLAAFATYLGYTAGVASFYLGNDSINPDVCSGPQSWTQLSSLAKFTELAFYLGPIITAIPYLDFPFSLAELVCAGLVLKQESVTYHRTTAVYDIVLSVIQLAASTMLSSAVTMNLLPKDI